MITHMIDKWIPDLLSALLFSSTFFIAVRALYLYFRVHSPRLLILGLSMSLIALTAVSDFVSRNMPELHLHTDWFMYCGQAVGYLFIFLSLLRGTSRYLRCVMVWHSIVFLAVLLLLPLSVILPDVAPLALRITLSGSQCILCFMIFFTYTSAFMSKQTRFSFLMSVAFLLLSFGYLALLQKYVVPMPNIADNIGDIFQMGGVVTLFLAVMKG